MRVGITSGAARNPLASTLVAQLTQLSRKPICVILAQPPTPLKVKLKQRLVALRDIVAGDRAVDRPDPFQHLGEFARTHGLEAWDEPLPAVCARTGIEILRATDFNAQAIVDDVRARRVDLLVNVGGGIFRRRLIEATGRGILNVHMGRLPEFRGMNALEWSLFHGQPIGLTLHLIDAGIDTGDILCFRRIPIDAGDTIATLRAKSLPISVELVTSGIESLDAGEAHRVRQPAHEGRQYFVMHPRLLRIATRKIPQDESRPVAGTLSAPGATRSGDQPGSGRTRRRRRRSAPA